MIRLHIYAEIDISDAPSREQAILAALEYFRLKAAVGWGEQTEAWYTATTQADKDIFRDALRGLYSPLPAAAATDSPSSDPLKPLRERAEKRFDDSANNGRGLRPLVTIGEVAENPDGA